MSESIEVSDTAGTILPRGTVPPGVDTFAPIRFSKESSPSVRPSLWFAPDFLLGAGMVIIQPRTEKVVVIHDSKSNTWMLPRGRKDVGESLEQCALREAFEETGYVVEFLPMWTQTRAPTAPEHEATYSPLNTEAIGVFVDLWRPRYHPDGKLKDTGGEYLSHWYVGQITECATPKQGTGMPDEQGYVSHLVSAEDALDKISKSGDIAQARIVHRAFSLFMHTKITLGELKKEQLLPPRETRGPGGTVKTESQGDTSVDELAQRASESVTVGDSDADSSAIEEQTKVALESGSG